MVKHNVMIFIMKYALIYNKQALYKKMIIVLTIFMLWYNNAPRNNNHISISLYSSEATGNLETTPI